MECNGGIPISTDFLLKFIKIYFDFNDVYVVLVFLLAFAVLYLWKRTKIGWCLLGALYLCFLISMTLLNREVSDNMQIAWVPFWSYVEVFQGEIGLLGQMIFNVVVFLPWCFLLEKLFPAFHKLRWGVGSAFFLSIIIELSQLFLRLGLFEFDDIFHNTLGALAGFYIWRVVKRIRISQE